MDNNQPQAGKKIASALKLIRQAYTEAGLLLYELDSFMHKNGWFPVHGNRTTRDVSSSLQKPIDWLVRSSFRYYGKNEAQTPNGACTRLGVNIVWWQEQIAIELEPFVIFGRTDGLEKDMGHWDLWYAWFHKNENPEQVRDVLIVDELENVSFKISSCFLTTITNKQDIASLGQKLLDMLEPDSTNTQTK